mmetsp:Transcript_16925/g.45890  ORF Transcript_16925/g.45890 Transcript_16925/m.45890 type:complete len:233 (+) Transcript_16925:455-1153(+)
MIPPGCPDTFCRQVKSSRFHIFMCTSPPLETRRLSQSTLRAETPPGCAWMVRSKFPDLMSQKRNCPSRQPAITTRISQWTSSTALPPQSPESEKDFWQPPCLRSHNRTLSSPPLTASIESQFTANTFTAPGCASNTRTHWKLSKSQRRRCPSSPPESAHRLVCRFSGFGALTSADASAVTGTTSVGSFDSFVSSTETGGANSPASSAVSSFFSAAGGVGGAGVASFVSGSFF